MKPVLVLISLLLLGSCATFAPQIDSRLVGNWVYADEVQSCRYSFNADGSFKGEVRIGGRAVSRFTGRWTVKENALSYTYLGDALGHIPPGATDRDRLLEITNKYFLIQAMNGEKRRYQRLRYEGELKSLPYSENPKIKLPN